MKKNTTELKTPEKKEDTKFVDNNYKGHPKFKIPGGKVVDFRTMKDEQIKAFKEKNAKYFEKESK